jgi:Concanavalin A-like lectin/glucanases superfamily
MKNKIHLYLLSGALILIAGSCQKMDHPTLGDYPKDANPPGGPLKFYVAFDGTSSDPLLNAVDSVRANFAASNPLTSIAGISGKAVQGADDKAIKYLSANDFGKNISSYSISVWLKNTVPPNGHYEVPFSLAHKDLYYSTAIHFDVYPGDDGSTVAKANAYYYMEQPDGSYFEAYLTGADGIPGLLDNNWHHLVFTYDETNSTFTLYKDGALLYTQVWTGHGSFVLDNSKLFGLVVGGSNKQAGLTGGNDGWMYSWEGGLDQFRLYGKKVLTASEVLALYNSKL